MRHSGLKRGFNKELQLVVKRIVDVLISAVALLALIPVLGAIALVNWSVMGRPALFRQLRGGLWGSTIMLHKFRTMTNAVGRDGNLLPDEFRLTNWGRFLRKYSLDELPQLWNVLLGDMSLVGPRPLFASYIERYDEFQKRRLEMKPGVTGLAQVSGRNDLRWEEKFRIDISYIDRWSLWLDCKILLLTFTTVVRSQGISSGSDCTMPEFIGSLKASAGDPCALTSNASFMDNICQNQQPK